MQDKDLADLCKNIYRKHKLAIETIIEYGKTSDFQACADSFLANGEEYEVLFSSPVWAWFLPKEWCDLIPENCINSWNHLKRRIAICARVEEYKGVIRILFEVAKMDDPELRLNVVKTLNSAGYKLTSKVFDKSATYSRFYLDSKKIDGEPDRENINRALKPLLEKAKEEFPKIEKVLRDVFESKK